MIDLIRKKKFSRKDNLLFIHTGGSAGLFGYSDRLRTRA
jgi:L-cysteate sulfo-lyase